MAEGIAPATLLKQVRNTASWAMDHHAEALREVEGGGMPYFRLLLAAHFCTVATFVPTDVDARIRHHTFVSLDAGELAAACDCVDQVASWDVSLVSARVVEHMSGHDGEWLAVRAGALGRALTIGANDIVERLVLALDEEIAREHRILARLSASDPIDWLRAATTVAHNLGDLSRVVEAWPAQESHAALRCRYARLGHDPTAAFGDVFVRAGIANKAIMSADNHRFLALRKPRALRASRELLLPIGPFFDGWGRTVATHPLLGERDRGEIVTALLMTHTSKPEARGALRALAGIDRATPRGLVAYESLLPARMRKLVSAGPVRDALKTSEEVFLARMRNLGQRAIRDS